MRAGIHVPRRFNPSPTGQTSGDSSRALLPVSDEAHAQDKPTLRDESASEVAQWLVCWAHNPKVRGSTPRFANFSQCGRAGVDLFTDRQIPGDSSKALLLVSAEAYAQAFTFRDGSILHRQADFRSPVASVG